MTSGLASGQDSEPMRLGRVRWWLWLVLLACGVILGMTVTPARVRHHLTAGQQLIAEGNADSAMSRFRTAMDLDPENPETHFWMARCFRKLGNLPAVRQHLDEALRLRYADPERLKREWWLCLAQTGQLRETEQHLATLISSPGEDGPEICEAYAKGYALNLQYDAATMLLEAWAKESPGDYRPHFRLGQLYLDSRQQSEKAESSFRTAVQLAPELSDCHRELGRALAAQQKLDEAAAAFQKCLLLNASDPVALLQLAVTLKDLKRYSEAETECRRAMELSPNTEKAQTLLAEILVADSRASQAVEILKELATVWPDDLRIRYALAMALQKSGRREESQQELRIYESLEPVSKQIEDLAKQLEKKPDDVNLRFQFGSLRLRHESRDEGVAWLQSILMSHPEHAETHQVLADYFSKIGDSTRAEIHRRRLSESGFSPEHATERTQ
ncbi:MAG: tetratricopeptide repeat protein, partial [Planctomycetota bacterium]